MTAKLGCAWVDVRSPRTGRTPSRVPRRAGFGRSAERPGGYSISSRLALRSTLFRPAAALGTGAQLILSRSCFNYRHRLELDANDFTGPPKTHSGAPSACTARHNDGHSLDLVTPAHERVSERNQMVERPDLTIVSVTGQH